MKNRFPFPTLVSVLLVAAIALSWMGKQQIESCLRAFRRPTPVVSLEAAQFYSRSLRKFSLGFDNVLADFSWIQLLQGASHETLNRPGVSWEYAMVHSVNVLDPKFYRAYWFGASFVSIFRRDKTGAKDILETWTKAQPLFWKSHYTLGFHLFHEMNDSKAAAPAILRAASLPRAPSWLTSLGIRLLSESGGALSALQSAASLYDSLSDAEGIQRLALRIRSLNLALQRAQWNERVDQFKKEHLRDPASLEQLPSLSYVSPLDLVSNQEGKPLSPELRALLNEKFDFYWDKSSKKIEAKLSKEDEPLKNLGVYAPKQE
jgi:hypothetical protein